MNHACLVAMYHYVRDHRGDGPRLRALSTDDFRRQLDWLGSTRRVVDYPRFEAALSGTSAFDEPAALLTFDDGVADHVETVVPALRARGWRGVFFVSGNILEDPPRVLGVHKIHVLIGSLGSERFTSLVVDAARRLTGGSGPGADRSPDVYRYDRSADSGAKHLLNYELPYELADRIVDDLFEAHVGDEPAFARRFYATRAQLAAMAAEGMTIGYHSSRHRVLARLTVEDQRRELADGIDQIRGLTGQRSVPFCYPYGHRHTYTAETLTLLDELGYSSAFNTVRRHAMPSAVNRFEIPRFDTRDLPPCAPEPAYA